MGSLGVTVGPDCLTKGQCFGGPISLLFLQLCVLMLLLKLRIESLHLDGC